MVDLKQLLSKRVHDVEASGIRRVFDLAATLKDPIDLSIGQPDFPPPEPMKRAAIQAIEAGHNGYTPSQGIAPLRESIWQRVEQDLGWREIEGLGLVVTSGTLGALNLALAAVLDPGDELILPDPYFVAYPQLTKLLNGKPVLCDTYPDFCMTAERVEPLLTARTKAVLVNSPSNPAGVTLTQGQCDELAELCASRGVLLISDEIYDEFVYAEGRDPKTGNCPSPARWAGASASVLVVRGFGKSYGCTGWRMGYAVGSASLISAMIKVQQYTYVCPPTPAQWGCVPAFECDVSETVARFQKRRDMVIEELQSVTEVATPGGAFFVFPKIPDRLGLTGAQFIERAIERNVLVINGGVFSARDTHFRISYAADEARLERGVAALVDLLRG